MPDPYKIVRFILDTNIVLDWLVFDDPSIGALRAAIESRRVEIGTHEVVIDELQRVLAYSALKLDAARQASVLSAYRTQSALMATSPEWTRSNLLLPTGFPQCRDQDDQPFIALAYHAKANALITRDKAILKLRKRAARFGVVIADINAATQLLDI